MWCKPPAPENVKLCEDKGIRPKLSAIMRRLIYCLKISRREHPGCGLGYSHSLPVLANLKLMGGAKIWWTFLSGQLSPIDV